MSDLHEKRLIQRAALHAALGDPIRLAIVEDLILSDRSPGEISERFEIGSNLLAHHLDTLESVGLVRRSVSAGDGRRKYIQIVRPSLHGLALGSGTPSGEMLFVCTRNSARSQLASALWKVRTGRPATSAGTHPSPRVHRGAVAAAQRAGLSLEGVTPQVLGNIPKDVQVVTVCDMVHEELVPQSDWWHWSIPDPVEPGSATAFDAVVKELEARIDSVVQAINKAGGNNS